MLGPVELVDEVDSTNRVLLDRARQGAPHGLVLVANHQTAGRGRLDRPWEAAPGAALLVSVLLRLELPIERRNRLSMAAGLAAVTTCRRVAGVNVGLKWPNDVLSTDGRKLAGILAESVLESTGASPVVIGMGLNVAAGPLPDCAVALAELAGGPVDRITLLLAWLECLNELLDDLGSNALLESYREQCWTLGAEVRIHRGHDVLEGWARDVADDGELLVDVGGSTVVISVGDVTHLRHVSPT